MAYKPKAVRKVYIQKAGSDKKRPLGIPVFEDKIVQDGMTHHEWLIKFLEYRINDKVYIRYIGSSINLNLLNLLNFSKNIAKF